ncbi:MAG: hypothetical protein II305_01635 [Clostridia bacterium]|nr:hypothetical protein [Clostridia bacterium]
MPDKKLTDNLANNSPILANELSDDEIKKALECCSTASCISNKCHYEKLHDIPTCTTKLTKDALDLINRQNAEIERLESLSQRLGNDVDLKLKYIYELEEKLKTAKAEAYKECIEKVKSEINKHSYGVLHKTVINFKLDNLLKEMMGDNNV